MRKSQMRPEMNTNKKESKLRKIDWNMNKTRSSKKKNVKGLKKRSKRIEKNERKNSNKNMILIKMRPISKYLKMTNKKLQLKTPILMMKKRVHQLMKKFQMTIQLTKKFQMMKNQKKTYLKTKIQQKIKKSHLAKMKPKIHLMSSHLSLKKIVMMKSGMKMSGYTEIWN